MQNIIRVTGAAINAYGDLGSRLPVEIGWCPSTPCGNVCRCAMKDKAAGYRLVAITTCQLALHMPTNSSYMAGCCRPLEVGQMKQISSGRWQQQGADRMFWCTTPPGGGGEALLKQETHRHSLSAASMLEALHSGCATACCGPSRTCTMQHN